MADTKKNRVFTPMLAVLLTLALITSVGVSYFMVRQLTLQHERGFKPDERLVRQARLLCSFGNELGRLLDDLSEFTLTRDGRALPDARGYIMKHFQPRMRALQARMNETENLDGALFQALVMAVDRALIMSAHFGDQRLREIAFAQAAIALEQVHRHLVDTGLEAYLEEDIVRPRFLKQRSESR